MDGHSDEPYNRTMTEGLLRPREEVCKRRGAQGVGKASYVVSDLTRWRSLPGISSELRKIELFRGCRQGVNPSLSAGPE